MRIFLSLFTLLFAFEALAFRDCEWTPKTFTRFEKGPAELWFFEVENAAVFNSYRTSKDQNFIQMQKFIRDRSSTDPRALIARQTSLFKRRPDLYSESIKISNAVRTGKLGKIRSISCLESLLLMEHMKRQPVQKGPTELSAYVLKKGTNLRVLYSSENEASVPFHDEIKKVLRESINSAWEPVFQIHSHPFSLATKELDIMGVVTPSEPDTNLYFTLFNDYKVPQVRISNGFSTFEANLTKGLFSKISDIRKAPITK